MIAKTGRKLPKPANGIVSRDLDGGEFVVLNTDTNEAHALQGGIGVVWRAACDGTWPELSTEQIDEAIEALTSLGLLAAPNGMTRRVLLQGAGAAAVGVGIMTIGIPAASAAGSLHGTIAFNLHDEVATYNSTNTANNSSSHGTPDFTFFESDDTGNGGGTGVIWTPAELESTALTYFASTTTNGIWANGSATTKPIIGPFSTSPFNGVSATPKPQNSGSQHGDAAVVKLVVPAPPATTSYVSGAQLVVEVQATSGVLTGSNAAWLYVLSAGVSGTTTTALQTAVQVTSTGATYTFNLGTVATGARYYVAIEDGASTTSTVVQLQVSASFPWSN